MRKEPVNRRLVQHTLLSLLKIAVALLVIGGIGTAVVVWGPGGEVRDSQADIVDLGFGPPAVHKRFGKTLERMGHDKPQVFDLNGNTIYFSTNYFDERPRQVMNRYQEELALQGVNDRPYYQASPDDSDQRLFTGLSGGVVPQMVSDDYITMGGMTMKGGADEPLEVIRQYRPDLDESQLFSGHRWVEMFWEPAHGRTTVLASWSDDKFDYAKMVPGQSADGQDLSVDALVPSCPGCRRVNRLRDLDADRLYESNIFTSTAGPRQIQQFYHRAMSARGWTRRKSNSSLSGVQKTVSFEGSDTTVLSFHREGANDHRILTILIYPIGQDQTAVHTSLAQNAHLADESE
jgi:hypothetical protein